MTRRRTPAAAIATGVGTAEVVADRNRPGGRTLLIDGQVHGHVDLADPGRLQLDYQSRLAAVIAALLPAPGADVLHLGGGAFAVPRALQATDPGLRQVVVERSAAIIRLAGRDLGLRSGSGIAVRKGDARVHLARCPDASVDVVVGDAFVGTRTPRHLTTVEFMAEVARALRPGGAYVVNLVDEQPWTVLAGHAAAARTAFADLVAVGSRGSPACATPATCSSSRAPPASIAPG